MRRILLTTALLIVAFGFTYPESSIESEKTALVQLIDDTSSDVVYLPTFKIYGELAPIDYLDGRSEDDSLTTAHGFLVIRVAGCSITPDFVESVKLDNRQANDYMISLHGENWKSEFENETGMTFSFPK
jgi:hypothetical protein